MITPIIVVGMNRSGTKWVSNILCSHEDVIGVQSERHCGILETNMFGAMQDKFNLSGPEDYVGFLELWAKTEFFRRTDIDKHMFYELTPRPRNFLEIFDLLMCEFARRNNKSYWLQKTSPSGAIDVLKYFKNARIVIVQRNLLDTLRSTWALHKRHGQRRIFRSTFTYVRQRKILDRIADKYNVAQVNYDYLRSQTSREITRICTELGLDPEKISSEIPYRKNTSFASDSQRKSIMSPKERLLVIFAAGLFRPVPLDIITITMAIKARLWRRIPVPLVSGSFGSLTEQLKDRSWGNE